MMTRALVILAGLATGAALTEHALAETPAKLRQAGEARPQSESVPLADDVAARRDDLLKAILAGKMKLLRRSPIAFPTAAYWLNQQTAQADEKILAACQGVWRQDLAKGRFHHHGFVLSRFYFLFGSQSKHFPGRMSREAEKAMLDLLWQWAAAACRRDMTLPERDWWIWASENPAAHAWCSMWSAAQVFARHPDYRERHYADGSSTAEMARAFDDYFKRFCTQRASRGLLVECCSSYNMYTLEGWYAIADFAEDPVLKRRMTMLLDLFWADWAIEQIDGVRGGSRHRCYPGTASIKSSNGLGNAWYPLGVGIPESGHPTVLPAAISFYRPDPIVVELAQAGAARGSYAYTSRRPGLRLKSPGDAPPAGNTAADGENLGRGDAFPSLGWGSAYELDPAGGNLRRYTWCTPDFVMGTSMVPALPREDWTGISSQNRWEGVIFAGHPTARIFTQPRKPASGSVYNAHWSVQNKGVLVVQRLKQTNARGQRVWFDLSLKRVEADGWVFAEAPRAYAAVRIVQGGTAWEADTAKDHLTSGNLGLGQWLSAKDEFSPVIIEVASQSDYPSFEAFQQAIRANPLAWKNNRLDYRSSGHKTQLTLWADYSQRPQIDGAPVDYRPAKVYDSPFIEGDFGAGTVTLRYGDKTRVLDFNKE